MGRLATAVGLALALVRAVLAAQPLPPELAWRAWFVAALEHRPGVADQALVEIGTWGFGEFDTLRRHLRDGLDHEFDREAVRQDVIRRGILLHTDIALLRPDLAVRFDRLQRHSPMPMVDMSRDAQYLGQFKTTAHWAFARELVERLPDGARDPMARAWYRAVAAGFLLNRELALAANHLDEALRRLPDDPWLLFYAGILHETYASGHVQNLLTSLPRGRPRPLVDSAGDELQRAAALLRRSATLLPGLPEPRLHLARVLAQLERHEHALAELDAARAGNPSAMQQYFIEMVAADARAARGDLAGARAALARASALFPRAQSPILALSALHRREGDVAGAAAVLARLGDLPGHTMEVHDPWWIYLDACVRDADEQMARVREMLEGSAFP